MIKRCEQPDCFKHLEDGFIYYKELNVSGDYVYAAFTSTQPSYLHLEVVRFSHNIMKSIICDWHELRKCMKERNITSYIITKNGNLESNRSYIKFLNKLGMSSPHEVLIGHYELWDQ